MNRGFLIFIFSIACSFQYSGVSGQGNAIAERYPIIPFPTHLQQLKGEFIINHGTTIKYNRLFVNEAAYLQNLLQNATGHAINFTDSKLSSNIIVLLLTDTITNDEGYSINIQPGKMILSAKYPAGMFRAIETVHQLLPLSAESKSTVNHNVSIPAVEINDAPLYDWRGMHLDVSRHFFSIAYLKKFIDVSPI
jgi:hexosaminidase